MISTNVDLSAEMKSNHLTAEFTEHEMKMLSKFSELVYYKKGDFIIKEGEPNSFLYIIKSGMVQLFKGDKSLVYKDGAMFGDRTFFDESQQQTETVISQGPTSVIKINVAMLFAADRYKDLQVRLLSKVASQLSTELEQRNERERKSYKALGMLTTNLLTVTSIYTLLLISLTVFVEAVGVSTYVDISIIIIFALVMVIIMKKSGYSFESFGVTTKNWKRHSKEAILLTLPVLFFFLILKWGLITFIPAFSHIPLFNIEATFADIGFSYSVFAFSVVVYILFSVVQEFIARAGLQSALYKFLPYTKRKVLISILLSNLLFAMAHSHINIWFALTAFLPGLYWGWMFARQRSLVGVSISHMMIGIWVLFILGFTEFLTL
ncbi:cyclic nucleotide-binding domain-containing protein [Halalkalibacter alkaliphilus]|uniref:Cyclic nucleotide-binding domain-containing protein n=1 Tax=Halalkalibacter alkaliphilus TaxID=2917993 RepID=A0A9X1ZYS8_9BACI|nr:cyclic nucleotide-binding domain-containing protein [Halalkalibacter alkaliphilus]MCL7746122.1 cyclic nucleotide-binding domain-containing protein [Halalkalibacter alkaliphilus]